MNSHKSVHELLSTPSVSRKKLNATYVKSIVRDIFPEYVATSQNTIYLERSNKLKDIGLTETIWETYRINALYDFCYQKIKLKKYEKILASVIKNGISKIESDSQYKSENFEVKIQSFPDMVFTEKDYPPLKITVVTEDEEYQESCFTGLLLSVERKAGFMEEERMIAEATILPLLLVDYTNKIFLESVKQFLEANFSCLVSPLKFSSCDLVWMLALFCPKNDHYTGVTVIEYEVPFEELNSIEYAIDPYTIAETWKRIAEPGTQEISEDQVYKFLSILERHFYNMFSINLSDLVLRVIKTPLARIQANHSILCCSIPV